jgi:hypothetical protein
MNDRFKTWIPAAILVGIIAGIMILRWWGLQPSFRPRGMPKDSIWIDAPALPISWHHGWWFGCWIDSDGHSNRCRLWGAGLDNPKVFEGQYVSCENHSPVAVSELKLKAPPDSSDMWVGVTSDEIIGPAVFLQNGKYLVPVEAPQGCEELRKRLKHKP